MALVLSLASLSIESVIGIYKVGRRKNALPDRMRLLHPDAVEDWEEHGFSKVLVISDMYRSAEASLAAVEAGRGAMPPGKSGHNFGLSIDLAVEQTMKKLGIRGRDRGAKKRLDDYMAERGWYCHRRDHYMGWKKDGRVSEYHHYNFLGPFLGKNGISPKVRTTMGYLEAVIQKLYGRQLVYEDTRLGRADVQEDLQELGLYRGELDGIHGPLTRQAVKAFQRAWNLRATGELDKNTQRTLRFLTCGKDVW